MIPDAAAIAMHEDRIERDAAGIGTVDDHSFHDAPPNACHDPPYMSLSSARSACSYAVVQRDTDASLQTKNTTNLHIPPRPPSPTRSRKKHLTVDEATLQTMDSEASGSTTSSPRRSRRKRTDEEDVEGYTIRKKRSSGSSSGSKKSKKGRRTIPATEDSILKNAFSAHSTLSSIDSRPRNSGDPLATRIAYLEKRVVSKEAVAIARRRCWSCCCCSHRRATMQVVRCTTPGTNYLLCGVIVLHALYIGVETDNRSLDLKLDGHWQGLIAESLFLAIFTIEFVVRLRMCGWRACRDLRIWCDAVLVSLGLIDWVIELMMFGIGGMSSDMFLVFSYILKFVHVAQVLRLLRLLFHLKELALLVQGIIGAMSALSWSFVLIAIVLYISGVFVTTVHGEGDRRNIQEWFGSLGSSLLTLFQLMTLEDWPEVVRGVMEADGSSRSLLFFLPFIALTNFVLLNVITGVVVERVLAPGQSDRALEESKQDAERLHMMLQLQGIFAEMNTSRSNVLCKAEMDEGLKSIGIMERFHELGFTKHELEHLFHYLEATPDEPVSIGDLVEGCLRAQGEAQSKHLLKVQYDNLRCSRATCEQVMELTRWIDWVSERLVKEEQKAKKRKRRMGRRRRCRVESAGCQQTKRASGVARSCPSDFEQRRASEICMKTGAQASLVATECPQETLSGVSPAGTPEVAARPTGPSESIKLAKDNALVAQCNAPGTHGSRTHRMGADVCAEAKSACAGGAYPLASRGSPCQGRKASKQQAYARMVEESKITLDKVALLQRLKQLAKQQAVTREALGIYNGEVVQLSVAISELQSPALRNSHIYDSFAEGRSKSTSILSLNRTQGRVFEVGRNRSTSVS